MTLGLVLTPYGYVKGAYPFEINKSGPSNKAMLCPDDPYYLQRGEYGFFHDTPFGGVRAKVVRPLGAIPTDAEIGKYYYSWYTPVQSAWVYAKEPDRAIPGPWVPPHNQSAIGPFGPRTSPLRGLAESIIEASGATTESSVDKLVRIIEEHQKKTFTASAIGTTFAVAASMFTIYRTLQGIIEDERRKKREVQSTP